MKKCLRSPNEGDKLIDNFVAISNSYNENPSLDMWNTLKEFFNEFVEYSRANPMPTKFYDLSAGEICNFVALCEELDTDDKMYDAINYLFCLTTKK